ncbi:hypothetical protein J5N97_018916 [Dioscorea zingiberensis]|uniref:Uncharacterized protein n=1 Tax=Dioscorea zingiberensis TaxID=325984 RepID=A0A9D5CD14_9LILI|nr:hypothetical protein J5N97_018916 [Dioscorea zingiberensis]
MTSTVVFVTTPCSLAKILLLVGVRVTTAAALASLQLLVSLVNFHVDLCCRVIALSIALVTLPFRILATLQRERESEARLSDIRVQLEGLAWENRGLEERLEMEMRERELIETVFEEIEEAHEKAMDRIDVLESELQNLKEENIRLTQVQGKVLSAKKAQAADSDDNLSNAIPAGTSYGMRSWDTGLNEKGLMFKVHGDPWGKLSAKTKYEKDLANVAGPYQFPAQLVSRNIIVDDALEQRRVVAIHRSLFSAILSLIVAIIIWKAQNPCMPLVAALFTVVGLSLTSVVQFFSTIKNKPAMDAVALLSINWFILGMLTSPSLPSVAEVLAPLVIKLVEMVFIWCGFSF